MVNVSRFVSVAIFGVLCAVTAVASPITVANFSFENLGAGLPFGCGTGCAFSTGPAAIPNWSGSDGTSGEFQPGTQLGNTAYFTSLSDGNTNAFSNGASPLSQTVGTTVALGITYTLMVDLGLRVDVHTFLGAADLLINGKHIPATGTTPAPGTWSVFTATYLGLPADVGKPITIELLSSGGFEANFDNVRLSDSTPLPEPASVSLLGLGLAGLLVFAGRKRATSKNP